MIAAQTRMKAVVLAILQIPLTVPVILMAVKSTSMIIANHTVGISSRYNDPRAFTIVYDCLYLCSVRGGGIEMNTKILGVVALVLSHHLLLIFVVAPISQPWVSFRRSLLSCQTPSSRIPGNLLGFAASFLATGTSEMGPVGPCSWRICPVHNNGYCQRNDLGKPVWGEILGPRDVRLNLAPVLLLTLVAYHVASPCPIGRNGRRCRAWQLLALLNIPFNYLSIYLLPTQHPVPVVSPGGGGIDRNETGILPFPSHVVRYICLSLSPRGRR
jgi:hypothetical protein